jgi:Zn-dependent peptidase ImmA (M78 family)
MQSIEALMEEADFMRVEVRELPMPVQGVLGLYSEEQRLILIDDTLNARQHLCALQHEIIHARHHDHGCGDLAGTRAERRARKETATSLIAPSEYAMAERIHEDADPRALALELGVTIQVIEDYRTILDHETTRAAGRREPMRRTA